MRKPTIRPDVIEAADIDLDAIRTISEIHKLSIFRWSPLSRESAERLIRKLAKELKATPN